MAPRLRVLAGPSQEELGPISVNTFQPHRILSELFDGEVVAHIKNFTDENGNVLESEYFDREDRAGVTWSIQVQGRFLVPHTADDILFGNTFDRPLKLPWGTSAVLRFMHYIDPTLDHDLQSTTKPWALSPLISTMPYFSHTRLPSVVDVPSRGRHNSPMLPQFPPPISLTDDTSQLYLSYSSNSSSGSGSETHSPFSSPASSASSLSSTSSFQSHPSKGSTKSGSMKLKDAVKKVAVPKRRRSKERHTRESELRFSNATQRRSYFSAPEKRKAIEFGPTDLITTDFCYGFINFSPTLSLQLPGGLSFDLMRYWDGQPVRFVCCERKETETRREGENQGDPWGRIFWCVSIEMVDDDEISWDN